MQLIFKCPPELLGVVPRPSLAKEGLPTWLKEMPSEAYNMLVNNVDDTVKRCPPFIDALACGFVIPLLCDLHVENGTMHWGEGIPGTESASFPRSPVTIHDPSQLAGTPYFDADVFPIKFNNVWSIRAPEGYALLFTHPFNRLDLPFVTLTGLIDSDVFFDTPVHFPAIWRDLEFSGTIRAGTPIAQVIPFKREQWSAAHEALSADDLARRRHLISRMTRRRGVYRRHFRKS